MRGYVKMSGRSSDDDSEGWGGLNPDPLRDMNYFDLMRDLKPVVREEIESIGQCLNMVRYSVLDIPWRDADSPYLRFIRNLKSEGDDRPRIGY